MEKERLVRRRKTILHALGDGLRHALPVEVAIPDEMKKLLEELREIDAALAKPSCLPEL
jgi:hypothetical protein